MNLRKLLKKKKQQLLLKNLKIKSQIWILSDSNEIRTCSHLVRKQTLKHLAKLAKSLSCVVSTFLYGAFDCMLLMWRLRILD